MTSLGSVLALCAFMGWGLATSPLPLAALGVMLLNQSPARAALTFTATWFACQLVAVLACLPLMHSALSLRLTKNEKTDIGFAELILGLVMLVAGLILWIRGRRQHSSTDNDRTSQFLHRAQVATPRDAAQLGVIFGLLNPTNIAYWLATALVIQRAHLDFADRALGVATMSLVASSTFIVVSLVALIFSRQVEPWLEKGRTFVLKHSSSVAPTLLGSAGLVMVALGTRDLGMWS